MRLNRRYFCVAGAALIGSSCTAGNTPPAASESFAVRLDVFNDRFYELIGRETKADILAEGFLWRAVDDEGAVLDVVVQRRRNTEAATRLLQKFRKFRQQASLE